MGDRLNISAFSGGKDSTAMILRQHELGERIDALLFTPTDNELPGVAEHIANVAAMVGAEVVSPPGPRLVPLIRLFKALPNWRQRWCTRMIKIEPCIAYLKAHPGSTLSVGLRADEEDRDGIYGAGTAIYRFPLREWDWGIDEVRAYIQARGVKVPARTDCALCYHQRISDWYSLWKNHPDEYEKGVQYEAAIGYTLRSPGRDTWPVSLAALRAEFERGRRPRGMKEDPALEDDEAPCRVCSL